MSGGDDPSALEELDLPHDPATLRDFVNEAVADAVDDAARDRRPIYCAVAGSHRYGFASAESDLDLRCVHVVPASEYAYLEQPAAQLSVNQDGTTEGFEALADVELRSFELREFGALVHGASPDVLELAFGAPTVLDAIPGHVDALADLVREHLPLNVPHAYRGLARSIYDERLDPDRTGEGDPRPKQFLHAYRALLAARYVLEREDVAADLHELTAAVDGGDPRLVDELVAARRADGPSTVPADLAERARAAIDEQFDLVSELPEPEKAGFQAAIDEWMRAVRS